MHSTLIKLNHFKNFYSLFVNFFVLSNFSQFEVQSAINTLNDQDSTIIGQYQSTCIAVDYASFSQNKIP